MTQSNVDVKQQEKKESKMTENGSHMAREGANQGSIACALEQTGGRLN